MNKDELLIQFPKIGSREEGYLAVAEAQKTCPFPIQRTYWVYGCPNDMKRGGHAHHNLHQILICVAGEVEVILHDGLQKYEFCLNDPTVGLYQKPLIWGDLVYHQDSVLVVLASEHYLAEDYIRDYQQFLNITTSYQSAVSSHQPFQSPVTSHQAVLKPEPESGFKKHCPEGSPVREKLITNNQQPTTNNQQPITNDQTYIHPQAIVETEEIGDRTKIWAFVHILPGVKIGENCNICDHVFIESGVEVGKGVTIKTHVSLWTGIAIEDYCFIGPNVAFTNDIYPRSHRNPAMQKRYFEDRDESWYRGKTLIGEGAALGANSTILCGLTVGRYAMVAAGAVVTKDVKPFELVGGVPARHMGWVDKEGRKVDSQPIG